MLATIGGCIEALILQNKVCIDGKVIRVATLIFHARVGTEGHLSSIALIFFEQEVGIEHIGLYKECIISRQDME